MINRSSAAYQAGRFVGKIVLISLGFLLGKKLAKKSIDKSFSEKK